MAVLKGYIKAYSLVEDDTETQLYVEGASLFIENEADGLVAEVNRLAKGYFSLKMAQGNKVFKTKVYDNLDKMVKVIQNAFNTRFNVREVAKFKNLPINVEAPANYEQIIKQAEKIYEDGDLVTDLIQYAIDEATNAGADVLKNLKASILKIIAPLKKYQGQIPQFFINPFVYMPNVSKGAINKRVETQITDYIEDEASRAMNELYDMCGVGESGKYYW